MSTRHSFLKNLTAWLSGFLIPLVWPTVLQALGFSMSTFTIILDYRGGTYLKQVTAPDPRTALVSWSHLLTAGEIPGLGSQRIAHLIQQLADDAAGLYQPIPIAGLRSVWCTGLPFGGLVNIVRTDLAS